MDEAQLRLEALRAAVTWANGWKNSTPGTRTVIEAAEEFESYLKGDA